MRLVNPFDLIGLEACVIVATRFDIQAVFFLT